MGKLRIALIESSNPMDAFVGRSESSSLAVSAKLIGHEALSFEVHSRSDFQKVCEYLATADGDQCNDEPDAPMVIHISAHGNSQGIAFGPGIVKWKELAADLLPIFQNRHYRGKAIISLSSCSSGDQIIHTELRKLLKDEPERSPLYIFSVPGKTIAWNDALVGWTVLYHKLASINFEKKPVLIQVAKEIHALLGVSFWYTRYDVKKKEYVRYNPLAPD